MNVVGAAAISRFGATWRGLGAAIADGAALPGVPDETPLANPRARKMMSRGAYLAARCLADLTRDAAWPRAGAGYFLGCGASGGSLDDVVALLAASIAGGTFSLASFGDRGLAACNPLLAFQLMNNFTLCHGAILEGVSGPNSALFSRGAGTTAALIEAVAVVRDGDCTHAIAGGADSATHPVTRAELARDGFLARGLVPDEGAALIVVGDGPVLATIDGCAIASGLDGPLAEAISHALASVDTKDIDAIVLAPWGPPVRDELVAWATAHAPGARVLDLSAALGESLAATPALAWVAAIDLIAAKRAGRVLVLAAGTDGDVGAAAFGGAA